MTSRRFLHRSLMVATSLALVAVSPSARSDEVDRYTFSGASFDDAAALGGTFTIDWTTGVVSSVDVVHTRGFSSDASTFGTLLAGVWNIGASLTVPDPAIYQISLRADNGVDQSLFLDFNRYTGEPYVGDAWVGSYLFIGTNQSVSLAGPGTWSVTAVPEPGAPALLLAGLGLFGVVFRRSRRAGPGPAAGS